MISDALKAYRAAKQLTQEQVAQKSGMSVRSIARLEQGKSRPHPTTLSVLRRLGVKC